MDAVAGLSLIVSAIVGIWGIYQTRITSQLSAEVDRLSKHLDQSIDRLHKAREKVIEVYRVCMLSKVGTPLATDAGIEGILCITELNAIVHVINDKELEALFYQLEAKMNTVSEDRVPQEVGPLVAKFLARIYVLIQETTERKTKRPEAI